MANPNIERFRGIAPKCRHCGRALRPNYRSESEGPNESTRKRKVYLDAEDQERMSVPFGCDLDDATSKDGIKNYVWGRVFWDVKQQRWYKLENSYKVKSRKFLGTFGKRGCSLFCNEECGWLWAVQRASKLP